MSMSQSKGKDKMDFGTNGLGMIDLDDIQQIFKAKRIDKCLEPMPIMNTICGANSELVFSEANQKLVFVENYH